jgi:gliding motility-associated-like protein
VDATLSWDLGDGESSTAPSPTNVYTTPGQYVVELTATLDGCSSTVSQVILVTSVVSSNPSSITLPNVFTPNGDRHNDLLLMDAVNITSVEVLIYNRWGQKVNELKRVGEVWDGRSMSGEHVSDGTYFYTLVAMGADGVEHTLTGHITVLR